MSPELHGRVRSLFDQALDRPEAERLSFVQSACTGDPEVLQAVVRLLEAHGSAESFLEDDTRPARHIGRYLVIGELGRGAMGIVYEAVDPLIGRRVAVKVIHLQAFANAGEANFLRERLFREARSAGTLSHPGVVVVYDVGQEGDLAFIAMERVEGPSLYQLLASNRKTPRAEAFDILRQTAAALDYAHRNGVVHRDIKPANIMLDRGVTAKIADFGIAKISSTEHHTLTGLVVGTPSYMSPEQIEALPSDGRSDQFSLAVVAYELLTGRRPFQSESLATLAHMIVYADRPSVQEFNPALPAALDTVFHRSLARLPADRYASCSDFVAALEAAAQRPDPRPAPVVTGRGSGAYTSALYFLIGSIAMLVLLAGFLLYWPRIKPQPTLVAGKADGPSAPEVTRFVAEPPSIVSGARTTLRWDVKGATEVVIDQGVGKVTVSGPVEVAPLQTTTYELNATGPGGRVTAPVSVIVTPAPKRKDRADVNSATQLCADAEAQWNAHQSKKAVDLFRQAASLGEPRCMAELGEIDMEDDSAEAVTWFRKAADAGNSAGMRDLAGMYYLGNGVPTDYSRAAYWYRKAAEAGNADAMYSLGRMYESGQGVTRDLKKARELYLKAAALGNTNSGARLARLDGNGK
jgi:tRNA A-37 threonylcarbamoyl transferase component Bud32